MALGTGQGVAQCRSAVKLYVVGRWQPFTGTLRLYVGPRHAQMRNRRRIRYP